MLKQPLDTLPAPLDQQTHEQEPPFVHDVVVSPQELLMTYISRRAIYVQRARRVVGDDAEDVVQDAAVCILQRTYNPDAPAIRRSHDASAGAYIDTTVRHRALDLTRRAKYRKADSLEEHLEEGRGYRLVNSAYASHENDVIAQQMACSVLARLYQEAPIYAEAFERVAFKGEDPEKYATDVGISRATVKTRVFRARQLLKALLEEEQFHGLVEAT